jgi:hypothetical protein
MTTACALLLPFAPMSRIVPARRIRYSRLCALQDTDDALPDALDS